MADSSPFFPVDVFPACTPTGPCGNMLLFVQENYLGVAAGIIAVASLIPRKCQGQSPSTFSLFIYFCSYVILFACLSNSLDHSAASCLMANKLFYLEHCDRCYSVTGVCSFRAGLSLGAAKCQIAFGKTSRRNSQRVHFSALEQ